MKRLNVLLLVIITLCWGPSFFFMKVALEELPFLVIVTTRLVIGAIFLLTIVIIQKKHFLRWIYLWKHFLIMSVLANIAPFCFINYAETIISSSLAGIINASQPIFTAVLAHYFLDTEKFKLKTLIGICTGFGGILLIFLPPLSGSHPGGLGIIYMAIAAISSATAAVYAKKHVLGLPNMVTPTYQLIIGSLLTLPFTLFLYKPHLSAFPSLKVVLCLLALGVFGTGVAFIIYYYLVQHAGATYLSTSSLLLPFVAIFLGVIFLQETLHWTAYIGCTLILVGLIISNDLINPKGLKNIFKIK